MTEEISPEPDPMLVDDEEINEINVYPARELLADLPIDLATAMCGQEALALFADGRPVDVLLCDLNMPDMDGIEFIRHLTVRDFHGAIALISAEGMGIPETVGRLATAHQPGMAGVLSKPLKRAAGQELLDQIAVRQPSPKAIAAAAGIEPDDGPLPTHGQPRPGNDHGSRTPVELMTPPVFAGDTRKAIVQEQASVKHTHA